MDPLSYAGLEASRGDVPSRALGLVATMSTTSSRFRRMQRFPFFLHSNLFFAY